MFSSYILILLGLISASPMITKEFPSTKNIYDKIIPYYGWIGFASAFYGLWNLVKFILNLSSRIPHTWNGFIMIAIIIVLGFISGYELIEKYILSRNENVRRKGSELLSKVTPFKIKIGILAIIIGVIGLL